MYFVISLIFDLGYQNVAYHLSTPPSEAMKVDFRSNMHMDSRVTEVAGFKSEDIFPSQVYRPLQLVQTRLTVTFVWCSSRPAKTYVFNQKSQNNYLIPNT